jgi:hypothetical protein
MSSLALQRSKRWLEEKGWHVEIVEKWNSWAHIRQDAYGLHDLLAIRHDNKGVWGINACEDDGAVQAHVTKYLNGYFDDKKLVAHRPNAHLPVWLSAGNRFSIFGWGKRGARGERKTWTLRVVEFYLYGAEVKWREVTPEPVEGNP